MITPEEIRKRAERKFQTVLQNRLTQAPFSSIEFPVGALSKDLAERRTQIDRLRQHSKEHCGTGYTLMWETHNTLTLGKQTVPKRVVIDTLEDYLSLIDKQKIFEHFIEDARRIQEKFPLLKDWIYNQPTNVINNHGKWEDLLTVCEYFVHKPNPGVYIRELPIPIHTKFIERNQKILYELLDQVMLPSTINHEACIFNSRFGLKDKPVLVRIRLLANQLGAQYGVQINDLSFPVNQLDYLLNHHIMPKSVLIVENLINFLTLPELPNSIGLFGSGFAIHLLRDIKYLEDCQIIYWGDMDVHGFEILSDLRGIFPKTQSLMMDETTFDLHSEYVVTGRNKSVPRFSDLTSAETQLAQKIVEGNLRLEQEHIPQSYALQQIHSLLA